ncbi:MAG TPA: family 20 glycosylhydrolase [Pyrinomonadaceae bacterium]|nr:family 20 glycosylhydrolase [Pyrinomonadaceae bacterium]
MKNAALIIGLIVTSTIMTNAQVSQNQNFPSIVPKPRSVSIGKGDFEFNYRTKIVTLDREAQDMASALNDYLLRNHGFKLEFVGMPKKAPKNSIVFERITTAGDDTSPETYELNITKSEVRIRARSNAGMFYALQTLFQMLPVKILNGRATLPVSTIRDQPRFKYRGMHLDVSRHFFPVSFVKKYIDLLAQYKFNQFHWHLTDDQGWRIEIKKYPKLTEIGSKRPESLVGRYTPIFKGDGVPVEGFYTQDEIRDVVAYAKARMINVIPEIELPGHSSAALAAYPEFGCKQDFPYKVQMTWGIFKEVYCPTGATFKFLEDVLDETIALFPDSPYIHIGGDEVLKDHWKESPEVQELMKRENLKDEHEVQSYFVRRMEKHINSKGKKIIGWDEILEGGLAPNAVVMSWRGEKGGIEAAKAKHEVIMTPTTYLYFDYGPGDPKYELLNIGGYLPLKTVYSYNPVPKELTEEEGKYILGAQANVWTEYIKTTDKVEYMAYPRVLALSEVVWSSLEAKNWDDFRVRLAGQFARLDRQNVNYRIPEPDGLANVLLAETDKARIELKPPMPGGRIFYTLDGSGPSLKSTEYTGPFEVALANNERKELKTIVVNAAGRASVIYAATLLRRGYSDAVEPPAERRDGVSWAFYKKTFSSVAGIDSATPDEKGESKSISLQQFAKKIDLKEPFAAVFDGSINIPDDGIYEFQVDSDDGAVLFIDGEAVVDNDGLHSSQTVSGVIPLRKGLHKFKLKYFQGGGDFALGVRYGLRGTAPRRIAGNELIH